MDTPLTSRITIWGSQRRDILLSNCEPRPLLLGGGPQGHWAAPVFLAVGMSTKHIRTAADVVRFGARVRIECGSCGWANTLFDFETVRRMADSVWLTEG